MTRDKLDLEITVDQIQQFDQRVPRYTSYPPVPYWDQEYLAQDHVNSLKEIGKVDDPLSIYLHIPFCIRRCLFCACNVVVTKREDRPKRYLKYLKMEISKTAEILNERNKVIQLHLGGGTPTHLTPDQMKELFSLIFEKFSILSSAELSIEVHPTVTSEYHIDVLSEFNFNRLSVGVQDFDPQVQERLNRHQTYEETSELIEYTRNAGFEGINVDLIYGLPYQTQQGLDDTLEKIFVIKPDRVALYSYAHFPTIFRHHKSIPLDTMATGSDKLKLFLAARKTFLENNYRQVGFDHFTTSDDELWLSYENKTLRRNFMGYTTKSGTDMLAFGWSGISEFTGYYGQNSKDMDEYEQLVEKYGTAVIKGHKLSEADKLRKEVIMGILCNGTIEYESITQKFGKMGEEIEEIAEKVFPKFEDVGLVERSNGGWQNTAKGDIFARIVASSFDENYDPSKHLFSKSV
ncbi:MAG: oxygen-independent coproporphyrinogen III oxidase [Candidatus Kariarchaeaceae archaeon]